MSINIDSPLFAYKQRVINAVKNLTASQWYVDAHPDEAHGADGVDYASDQLDEALTDFAAAAAPSQRFAEPVRLGAVVLDKRGRRYVRYDSRDPQPWWQDSESSPNEPIVRRYAFEDIDVADIES